MRHPKFIPGLRAQIRRYGLEQRVIGVQATSFESGERTQAFDSTAVYSRVLESFREQATPLVAAGVDVLVPGGGIPMLLFANESNFSIVGAPVVNGLPILLKMSQIAVELKRLNGLTVSRSGDMMIRPNYVMDELLGP